MRRQTGMFPIRVSLLFVLILGAQGVLIARVAHLTLNRGDEFRDQAEARLERRIWLPTTRGSILDRKGRVISQDRPTYEIAIDYDVLSGEWIDREADLIARRSLGAAWSEMGDAARDEHRKTIAARLRALVDTMLFEIADLAKVESAVLENRRDRIVRQVESMQENVSDVRRRRLVMTTAASGAFMTPEREQDIAERAAEPIRERTSAHVLAQISDDDAFAFTPRLSETTMIEGEPVPIRPGLRLTNTRGRAHPLGDVIVPIDRDTFPGPLKSDEPIELRVRGSVLPIVGEMRDRIYAEDVIRRRQMLAAEPGVAERVISPDGEDLGKYFPEDAVGHTGVEAGSEHTLRGTRGLVTQRLDTGETTTIPPIPGQDLYSTLDIMLQSRIAGIMSPESGLAVVQPWHENENIPVGERLSGAAVVLDIPTGDILAMVSTPTMADVDRIDVDDETARDLIRLHEPSVNKAIGKPYPPGSIAKAMMVCGAAHRGDIGPAEGIPCTGHLLPTRPDLFRCWIYKSYGLTHSPNGEGVSAVHALEVSCNIFFYTVGRRLGPGGIQQVYREFGVGENFGLGIGPEWPGNMGPRGNTNAIGESDATLMGIGQGPVTWTPLHAADAYATLARAGARVKPRLLIDGSPRVVPSEVPIPRWAISQSLEGLRLAVRSTDGTGHSIRFEEGREPIFNTKGVEIWGKTGTATAPPLRYDPDGPDGPAEAETIRAGDHSWFVVLVGPEGGSPRFAISVIMEYAGSGGKVSGPITNQIIHALQAEGYL